MRIILTAILPFIFCSLISCQGGNKNKTAHAPPPKIDILKLKLKAQDALNYCQSNQMNTDHCILINMSRPSGLFRLFVWSFEEESIKQSALVAHGCCNYTWGQDQTKNKPSFSNVPESYCSSLGKYKIGQRGWSNWGINVNYKLHGLEATNDNALDRLIVLHSWEAITNEEVYPAGTPEGWGCPAVSNEVMRSLDQLLKASSKNVLMWIYQ